MFLVSLDPSGTNCEGQRRKQFQCELCDFADSVSSSKVAMSVEKERALVIMESSVKRVA